VTTLNLSRHKLGPVSAIVIGELLKRSTTLRGCNLSYNALGELGGQHIAAALAQGAPLEELDLSNNGLGPVGGEAVAQALPSNDQLTTLRLGSNHLVAQTAVALAQALSAADECNRTLTFLDVSNNQLETAGLGALAAMLRENTMLSTLTVRHTHGGKAARESLQKVNESRPAEKPVTVYT